MFFCFVTSGGCRESILISEYIASEGSCAPQYIAVGGGGALVETGARRPVSRVLSVDVRPRDGHSSGTPVTGRLARPTRAAGPETDLARSCDRDAPPLLGLAPGGVCRAAPVAGHAVRSYRTLSPLLAGLAARGERSALCGTFPGVAPAGRYPAPCLRGARTFLRRARFRGDGGHPAVWHRLTTPARRPGQAGPAPTRVPTRSSRAAVSASATPSTRA